MLIDLASVARSLREDTFADVIARLRHEIQAQLRATGTYTVREGQRTFTITRAAEAGDHQPR